MRWFAARFDSKAIITESSIEHQFEEAHRRGMLAPPMFSDENFAYGRGRLSGFRSPDEWLVVFEYLGYIGETDQYRNMLYCYGNKIKIRIQDVSLFELASEEDLNPLDFRIFVRGGLRHIHVQPKEYTDAGIDLNLAISGDVQWDRRVQILRLLVTLLSPEDLFLSDFELLQIAGRPLHLPKLIELYEWSHPDPRLPDHAVLTPCLKRLARSIADNDPTEYRCPAELINTHWSAWPGFGVVRR